MRRKTKDVWAAVAAVGTLLALPPGTPAQPLTTRAEAQAWLRQQGLGTDPEALGLVLSLTSKPISAALVRAYLLAGASAVTPLESLGDTPLNVLAAAAADERCAPGVAAAAEVLIAAGASVDARESTGRRATVTMAAVTCQPLLKVVLARKPDLDALDAGRRTAMHYALDFGKPRETAARMLMDAGFNLAKWRADLLMWFSGDQRRIIERLGAPAK